MGFLYHHTVSLRFGFRVRDVDCDFRLVRKSVFDRIELHRNSGVICLEMVVLGRHRGQPEDRP